MCKMNEKPVKDSRVQTFISTDEYIMKINNIHDTMKSLEESLKITRNLEAEQWLYYSNLKTKNKIMMDDLKRANKRNKNMLSRCERLDREEIYRK